MSLEAIAGGGPGCLRLSLESAAMGSSWAPLIGPLSVLDSVLMGSSWAPLIGPLSVLIGINFYGQFLGTTDWSFVCGNWNQFGWAALGHHALIGPLCAAVGISCDGQVLGTSAHA